MAFTRQSLMFKEIEPNDLPMLREWRNDPAMASGWFDPRSVQTLQLQGKWYSQLGPCNQAYLAGELDRDNRFATVGLLRFTLSYERGEARLTGTDVAPDAQGKGYGKRILRAGAEYVLNDLGFHRVTAECLAENVAAMHIIMAANFKPEGVLRQFVWRNGKWCNWHLFSLLREELT